MTLGPSDSRPASFLNLTDERFNDEQGLPRLW